METYNMAELTNKLQSSRVGVADIKLLANVLGIENERSLYKIVSRLMLSSWLVKIEKNKYRIFGREIHDFEIANFLYQPSYVSFESALNYWGILSQFPFEISSATLKKSKTKDVEDKSFVYNKVNKKCFGGFVKVGNFVVASREKALVDQIYLWSKGLKQLNWDEYDLSQVDMKVVRKMTADLNLSKKLQSYIDKKEA